MVLWYIFVHWMFSLSLTKSLLLTDNTTLNCDSTTRQCVNNSIICTDTNGACKINCQDTNSCYNTTVIALGSLSMTCNNATSCNSMYIYCGNTSLYSDPYGMQFPMNQNLNITLPSQPKNISSHSVSCNITVNHYRGLFDSKFVCLGHYVDSCTIFNNDEKGMKRSYFYCGSQWMRAWSNSDTTRTDTTDTTDTEDSTLITTGSDDIINATDTTSDTTSHGTRTDTNIDTNTDTNSNSNTTGRDGGITGESINTTKVITANTHTTSITDTDTDAEAGISSTIYIAHNHNHNSNNENSPRCKIESSNNCSNAGLTFNCVVEDGFNTNSEDCSCTPLNCCKSQYWFPATDGSVDSGTSTTTTTSTIISTSTHGSNSSNSGSNNGSSGGIENGNMSTSVTGDSQTILSTSGGKNNDTADTLSDVEQMYIIIFGSFVGLVICLLLIICYLYRQYNKKRAEIKQFRRKYKKYRKLEGYDKSAIETTTTATTTATVTTSVNGFNKHGRGHGFTVAKQDSLQASYLPPSVNYGKSYDEDIDSDDDDDGKGDNGDDDESIGLYKHSVSRAEGVSEYAIAQINLTQSLNSTFPSVNSSVEKEKEQTRFTLKSKGKNALSRTFAVFSGKNDMVPVNDDSRSCMADSASRNQGQGVGQVQSQLESQELLQQKSSRKKLNYRKRVDMTGQQLHNQNGNGNGNGIRHGMNSSIMMAASMTEDTDYDVVNGITANGQSLNFGRNDLISPSEKHHYNHNYNYNYSNNNNNYYPQKQSIQSYQSYQNYRNSNHFGFDYGINDSLSQQHGHGHGYQRHGRSTASMLMFATGRGGAGGGIRTTTGDASKYLKMRSYESENDISKSNDHMYHDQYPMALETVAAGVAVDVAAGVGVGSGSGVPGSGRRNGNGNGSGSGSGSGAAGAGTPSVKLNDMVKQYSNSQRKREAQNNKNGSEDNDVIQPSASMDSCGEEISSQKNESSIKNGGNDNDNDNDNDDGNDQDSDDSDGEFEGLFGYYKPASEKMENSRTNTTTNTGEL